MGKYFHVTSYLKWPDDGYCILINNFRDDDSCSPNSFISEYNKYKDTMNRYECNEKCIKYTEEQKQY